MARRRSNIIILVVVTLIASACSVKQTAVLPKDLLGISVGMNRSEAIKRLQEIAEFESNARKRQELWKLKDTSRFSRIAVGYTAKDQVRYVTAFVEREVSSEPLRFSDVGNLAKAKTEIMEPHYRYIWEV